MMMIVYLPFYHRFIVRKRARLATSLEGFSIQSRIVSECRASRLSTSMGGSSTLSTVAFTRPLTIFGATSSSVVILSDDVVVAVVGLVVAVRTNVAAVSSVHCDDCCR
mmetsp:Transcript_50178/g.51063  ORF Transcript_50178/g.51063 Transcript_50178/m.51063 type:complete len:108 (+) Transcript_50178:591-914(+)